MEKEEGGKKRKTLLHLAPIAEWFRYGGSGSKRVLEKALDNA